MGACMSNGQETTPVEKHSMDSSGPVSGRPEPYHSYSFITEKDKRPGGGYDRHTRDKYQASSQAPIQKPLSPTSYATSSIYDRYRFVKKLEDTHFGSVWEGSDVHRLHGGNGRVAVKESKKSSAMSKRHCRSRKTVPEDVDMEIKIHQMCMSDPECPNAIIRLHDVITSDPTNIYMIMEFGDGGSLLDHLQNQTFPKRSSEITHRHVQWKTDVRRWFRDICLAVEFMHDRNLCHKDLSLQNLLLKSSGSRLDVKVVDFGLSEMFAFSDPTRKCMTRAKVGKSNFASAECYSSKVSTFDAKSNDCWCLGVILFMCLTQCSPYENPLDENARTLHRGEKYIRRNLQRWRKSHLVDDCELHLLASIFRSESIRYNIRQILEHPYIRGGDRLRDERSPVSYRRSQSPEVSRRQRQDESVTWKEKQRYVAYPRNAQYATRL